jgi:hypothetical protein
MTQSFFQTESAHQNIMYWWHGVIVDDAFWAGCTDSDVSNENSKLHYAKKLEERPKKGWGKRYKVAIVGRHYAIKGKPEEADLLEMAEVVYPVTAGCGLGGSKQTSALRQGAHVIGFYADGPEGRHPIILGAFGVNEQNEPIIYPGDPPQFFQVRSGTKGICGEKLKPVSEKDQNLESDKRPIESPESPLQASQSHKTKVEDGNLSSEVLPTSGCESPTGFISQTKSLLNTLSNVINLVKQGSTDLTSTAQSIINSITSQITGLSNGLMDRMRGYLINKINNGVKDVMNKLPPFLRPDFNLNTQGALGALSCAFNKIKNNIFGIIKDLIKQFIDNYINAPLCAATSFVGGLLGNLMGQINGAVNTAVGAINSILNIGFGFANLALNVIDIALDLLKLFDCDKDNPECPGTVKWSFWRGPNEIAVEVQEGASRIVTNILNEVETVLPGGAAGAAANPCNSRQVPCGPPTVQIIGGGGSGALANPVVSVTGKILGLDFSKFGSGFTSSPQINVVDSCGTGGGAVIKPVMKPTGTFNEFQEEILELTGAVVEDSGTQYLPAPNGTTGGNGLIFSQPSDTILFRTGSTQIINGKEIKGTGYDVYEFGTTFQVREGDEIYLPQGTLAEIYNSNGEVVQRLNGLGHLTNLNVEFSGTLTAPRNSDNIPTRPSIEVPLSAGLTLGGLGSTIPSTIGTLPNGEQITISEPFTVPLINKLSYPVVAEIESVFIKNPGFGYTENDIISIVNNKGAELEFRVNEVGEVTEVIVVNGGLGFNDVPFIAISSPTGFNFEAVSVFKFRSLSEIDLNIITPPPGAKILGVVDCVGKIPLEQEFNIVR